MTERTRDLAERIVYLGQMKMMSKYNIMGGTDSVVNCLMIKGKKVISENADISCNVLNASDIRITSGGVKINGECTLTGNIEVKGEISGTIISDTPQYILNKCRTSIVSMLFSVKSQSEKNVAAEYYVTTGCFVSADGWVLTGRVISSDNKRNCEIFGTTIVNGVTKSIKASNILIDDVNNLCLVKFPDVTNHEFVNLSRTKTQNGEQIYVICGNNPPKTCHITVFPCYSRFVTPNLCLDKVFDVTLGDPIINSRGDLVGLCQFVDDNCKSTSSRCTDIIRTSIITMMNNNIDIITKYYLGIDEWNYVNTYDILTCGLLGKFDPTGIIIDKLNADSNIGLERGTIITEINDVKIGINEAIKFEDILYDDSQGINVRYILPPYTEVNQKTVKLIKTSLINGGRTNLSPILPFKITREPYVTFYSIENDINAKRLYEQTHQEELKRKKQEHYERKLLYIKERRGFR